MRNKNEDPPLFKHLGIYAYRLPLLEEYVSLEPGELEEIEGLEQLRLLENGHPVQVVEVSFRGRDICSVDRKEDVLTVEKIIAEQGEIV